MLKLKYQYKFEVNCNITSMTGAFQYFYLVLCSLEKVILPPILDDKGAVINKINLDNTNAHKAIH